jgi:cytochrome c biogenesis protein CcmG/thiol:disulfide interchange protein DsbE
MKLEFVLLGTLALGAVLLIGNPGPALAASGLKNQQDRQAAPDFLLTDSRGSQVRLSDYRGKVVVLNFWATWCGPCKAEIPWFAEFESKYKGSGLAVLGVSMDDVGWKSVRPFIAQSRINYRVMVGDDATASRFGGIDSLPETLLIDRKGRIASRQLGLTAKTTYEEAIVELLRQ